MKGFWITATDEADAKSEQDLFGGKGRNLFKLQRWGLPVPEFGVLTSLAYAEWVKNRQLPAGTLAEIRKSIQDWNAPFVAVRSSMGAEDGAQNSFAGLFESYLFVQSSELEEVIGKGFEAAHSQRVGTYLEKKGLDQDAGMAFALVIQKMVFADASGVAFSRAPMGNSALTYIESAFGQGEGVVSGLVEVDTFRLDRFQRLVDQKIALKSTMITASNTSAPVPEEKRLLPSLAMAELLHLNQKLLDIEAAYGREVDIEWAYERGKLYFLQVRPITQIFPPLEYFTDTNLSESYPGLTCPLTGDFVNRVYAKVFHEIGELMGFSPARQERLQPHYQRLVQYHGGHLYYNLQSYYHILASLPGGTKNIDNWHRMIGGRRDERAIRLLADAPPMRWNEKLRFYGGLLRLVVSHRKIFEDFCRNSVANQVQLNGTSEGAQDAQELFQLLEKTFNGTKGFGLTVLNDYLIMLSMQLLSRLLSRYGWSEEVLPSLIKTTEGVESLRPLHELDQLVGLCRKLQDPKKFMATVKDFLDRDQDESWERKWPNLYRHMDREFSGEKDQEPFIGQVMDGIKTYLNSFGDRCFEELKLESFTFNQSPQVFFQLLSWKLSSPPQEVLPPRKVKGAAAGEFNRRKLSLLDRLFFDKILSQAHRFIAMREKTRLLRGQYYGWARTTFLRSFLKLKQEFPAALGKFAIKDFFHCGMKSYFDWAAAGLPPKGALALRDLITAAKGRPKGPVDFPEFFCHPVGETEPPYFLLFGENGPGPGPGPVPTPSGTLQGNGASQGNIQGEVLVLHDPKEAMLIPQEELRKKILVTKNTDPAWVHIMARCAGLVSEKGSLLSHTAIIGRELGIPTVVGVKGATQILGGIKEIIIDGQKGTVEIL